MQGFAFAANVRNDAPRRRELCAVRASGFCTCIRCEGKRPVCPQTVSSLAPNFAVAAKVRSDGLPCGMADDARTAGLGRS
jgi:hypothetical protein